MNWLNAVSLLLWLFRFSSEVSRCGDDTVRTLNVIATTEKEDIRVLNDRLGDLFSRLERARSDSGNKDNALFLSAIAGLQEEIKKLKAAYEIELNSLRLIYLPYTSSSVLRVTLYT